MKKDIMNLMAIIIVAIVSVCVISCSKDDDSIDDDPINETYEPTELERKLFNTSWKLVKSISYYGTYTSDELSSKPQFSNNVITFSSENWTTSDSYKFYVNGKYVGCWYQREKDHYIVMHYTELSPSDAGAYSSVFGFGIATINNNTLQLRLDMDESYHISTYTKINSEGGGGTDTKSLYFTNFYSTSTQTSVTVRFYTNERATSATIKYGKTSATSSVSTTIANKEISATIRNLSKGTKYYVKCTATNSNGSVTSEEYPVMTNY